MDNNTQTPPVPEYQPPTPPEPASAQTSKMAVLWLVVGAAIIAVALWWWMAGSDRWADDAYPVQTATPTPEAQEEPLEELNQLDVDLNLDAEFEQIDQDLNNL